MSSFHYPYHFVPVSTTDKTPSLQPGADCGNVKERIKLNAKNLGTASHDRYHRDTLSGTIICTLTTKGPVVCGGRQKKQENGPTIIYPFEINGKPAIPASTLRGCISSIAEAASNSALRVLDNRYYSRRQTDDEASGKQGILLRTDDGWQVRDSKNNNLLSVNPEIMNQLERLLDSTEKFRGKRFTHKDSIKYHENNREIDKIAPSKIWREEYTNGNNAPCRTNDFFKTVNAELLPFNKTRKALTPAELLFGCVEENEKEDQPADRNDQLTRALASRIVFHHALLYSKPEPVKNNRYSPYLSSEEGIVLRILAEPKPPCPSLYFKKSNLTSPIKNNENNKCYIAKKDLQPGSHHPQGRKFYLHHKNRNNLSEFGRKAGSNHCRNDQNARMKSCVRPLAENCVFHFSIDFDNLTTEELGLLLYSLDPDKRFHHKIGMAKPLGLGSVKIEPAGLALVDRKCRYSADGAITARYQSIWIAEGQQKCVYSCKPDLENNIEPDGKKEAPAPYKKAFQETTKSSLESVHKCLIMLGQLEISKVSYAPGNKEQNSYQWFVNNEKVAAQQRQGLIPLDCYPDPDPPEALPTFRDNT